LGCWVSAQVGPAQIFGTHETLKGYCHGGNGFLRQIYGQNERGAGGGLLGEMHLHLTSAERGKFGGDFGPDNFGRVAVAAEVNAIQMPEVWMQNLLQEISGAFVGKMAVPAGDALLEVRRAKRIVAQEIKVVIGFEQENFAFAHAIGNEAGAVAKIGEPADARGGGVNHKANRLNGVVRHGESFDGEVAHFKGMPGFENPKLKITFVNVPDFIGGMAVAINRNAELGGQHAQAGDVVGMFMGDENAIEPFGGAIERE